MDHQSFRYYIPGIVFLIPIYVVTCWITISKVTDSDIRVFVLVGGITTFPTISLPIGWWIYNAYRVWWLKLTKGGYENKDFLQLIRNYTKPFYSPLTNSILIDFTQIKGIESWLKIEPELFRKTFYPFTSKIKFKEEIKQKGVHPKFTEPLSDFILFKDSGYDYARSISSVRYGLESSVFAIILGGIYAFGLKVIWLHQLKSPHQIEQANFSPFIFWIIFLIVLTAGIIITLFLRWKYTDKEYDARLILSTLTSMSSNYFDTKAFTIKIPKEVVEKVEELNLNAKSYAAFDLDNTLLIDDIGEAVFATLVRKKLVKDFNWDDYIKLIDQNREAAYKKVIEVMKGLELQKLKQITYEIIKSEDTHIEIGEEKIPIPKPNTTMQSLISLLKTKGIDVYIVTASNKVSAEIICWEYFGIPSSNVLGAIINVDSNQRIANDSSEIPYGEEKVNILKKKFKDKPVVTGGDGMWDKFLLDYTISGGIKLWLGQNTKEYQKLKDEYYHDSNFYHVARK